jgi:hypothetical protein
MWRTVAETCLAIVALFGVVITNGVLLARLGGYVSFELAMFTATVAGIGTTLAGGFYLLARLSDIEKRRLSI